ncbi:hypothetical protein H0H92_009992 [Tricholoma furcatifolium]|nr:hypothetical protein H0H92_009992 [Tricholoma furcatifolium]
MHVRSRLYSVAHDAITHPDHPLHVDGVQGVQLYQGTFETGESRLLFSSAQVDYIRYWLHAMQLTKEVIPLPYSDCLLTESSLRSVSRVVYADGGALRSANKQIDKNNKRLKGSNPTLKSRRETFERVRTFYGEKKGVWCALDFEGWEHDHTVITEFGWRLVGWKDGYMHEDNGHIIVAEHRKYTNSQYVPDHRYDYGFGESDTVKKAAFPQKVCDLLDELKTYGPVFLVFHDDSQDIKYLKSLNVPLEGLSYVLPDMMPDEGIFVVDTSDLFGALEGTAGRRSLRHMCNLMQIKTANLHNGGNDAYYTLEAMISMANGDPVDMQREKRWPKRTGDQGVKVEFKEEELESDFSDEEFGLPKGAKIIESW